MTDIRRPTSELAGTDDRQPMTEQSGSVMVIVMVILVALLSGGAVALYIQITDTRSAAMTNSGRQALYCAEAGLNHARGTLGANYTEWNTILAGGPMPPWYPIEGDIDDPPDGVNDFVVTIRDNEDEFPVSDLTRDNDLGVFITSRCTKYPDAPKSVVELLKYTGNPSAYRDQSGGGAGNTNNQN